MSICRPDLDQFDPERAAIHQQARQALLPELARLPERALRLLAFGLARGASDDDIALNNPRSDLPDQIATVIAERMWTYGTRPQRHAITARLFAREEHAP